MLLSFRGSLASMVNVSVYRKCVLLNNQPYMTRPTLIDLNIDYYVKDIVIIHLWLI